MARGRLLELRGVRAGYGRIEVLHGLDLTVAEGEIITIIGANGAGKSTLLKAISGVVRLSGGPHRVRRGAASTRSGWSRSCPGGSCRYPEGRQLFGPLTVAENLALGSYSRRRQGTPVAERLKKVFALFPRLEERLGQQAGTLSGGEQQMLAVGSGAHGRAARCCCWTSRRWAWRPSSCATSSRACATLNEEGLTMVLVEQDARIALSLAHRGLVMERGRIVLADYGSGLAGRTPRCGPSTSASAAAGAERGTSGERHERDLEP